MAHYRNVIRAARDSGVARSVAGSGLDADPSRRSATRTATGTSSSRSPRAGARSRSPGHRSTASSSSDCWPAPAPAASSGYPPPIAGYRWSPALTSRDAWRLSWPGRGRFCPLPLPPRPGIFRVAMTSCPLYRVSVPGWADGSGGDGCLPGAAASASRIRGQCDAFSLGMDMLICSSLSFLLGNWRQRQTRKLC
jgi:hypothetical protein